MAGLIDTLSTGGQLELIYIGYFGRAADGAGYNFWATQNANAQAGGQSADVALTNIANAFGDKSQSETTTKYPFLTTTNPNYTDPLISAQVDAFINSIYQNLFNHAPDASGAAYWKTQLTGISFGGNTPPATPIGLGKFILAVANGAIGADATILTNKVTAATYFTQVTSTAGLGFPANAAFIAAASADIAGVTADSATVTSANSGADSFVSGGGGTGTTYDLKTGIDTIVGTASNDTINGGLNAGALTFTSLDNIDGAGGTDTLNITIPGATGLITAGITVKNVEIVNLTSSGVIESGDVSSFAGLKTLNIAAGDAIGNTTAVKAAATVDINATNALGTVQLDGGNNVTVSTTVGDIVVGAGTAAAGNVTATDTSKGGTIAITGKGALTASSVDGAITFVNGTSVTATASKAVDAATVKAHLDAQTAATTIDTAAQNDTDAAGKAKIAAAAKVTALATLATAITNATNVAADQSTAASIGLATTTALGAGAITLADKVAIDLAFANGLVTSTAAARTAAQAVVTPLQTAATTASNAAIAADAVNDANAAAALAAATALVNADGDAALLVDGVKVTATTNTALTAATIKGNYGSAGNAVTDGSTLSNTLTKVTLENAGAGTYTGKALTEIEAKGMAADVTVVNSTAAHTEKFTLEAITAGTYKDANATTVNIVTNGSAQNVLTGLDAASAKNINITGAAGVDLGTLKADAAAVIDASGSSGKNTATVDVGQKYIGGSGVDTITADAGNQTATVDGGAGTADKLIITGFDATKAAKFTGFEVLQTTVDADVSKFVGITSEIVDGSLTLSGLSAAQAGDITVRSNGTYVFDVTGATTVGQLDTVKLTVSDGAAKVNTITLTDPSLGGVETLNLVATDNVVISSLTNATALTNVSASGAGTLKITSGAVALNVNSVVDASAMTGAVTLDFSAGTSNGVSLKGGSGNDTLTGTDIAGKGNLLSGGAGNNTLTGGKADDIFTAGDGNNTVVTGDGANTVTLGNGSNKVTGDAGVDKVTVGNGINVISTAGGDDVIVTGTGYNLVTGGAGADKITFGAHAAGVTDGIVMSATGDSFVGAVVSGVADANLKASGGAIDIVTGLKAGDTIDLTALTVDAFTAGAVGTTIASATGGTIALTKGTYDGTTGTFTATSSGTDSLLSYDNDGTGGSTNIEHVILVGYVGTATTTNDGLITLG